MTDIYAIQAEYIEDLKRQYQEIKKEAINEQSLQEKHAKLYSEIKNILEQYVWPIHDRNFNNVWQNKTSRQSLLQKFLEIDTSKLTDLEVERIRHEYYRGMQNIAYPSKNKQEK